MKIKLHAPVAVVRWLRAAALLDQEYYDAYPPSGDVGFRALDEGAWRYTSQGGNVVEFTIPEGCHSHVEGVFNGRRHALKDHPGVFALLGHLLKSEAIRYEYVDSQRADLKPWETTTSVSA